MDILNITFNVENTAVSEWKKFMAQVFIPYANVQGNFAGHNYYKAMVDDPDSETYSYQLIAKDEKSIPLFLKEIFPALHREMTQAFGEKALLFHTILKEEKI